MMIAMVAWPGRSLTILAGTPAAGAAVAWLWRTSRSRILGRPPAHRVHPRRPDRQPVLKLAGGLDDWTARVRQISAAPGGVPNSFCVAGVFGEAWPQPVGEEALNLRSEACLAGEELEHAEHLHGTDASRQLRVERVDTCPLQERRPRRFLELQDRSTRDPDHWVAVVMQVSLETGRRPSLFCGEGAAPPTAPRRSVRELVALALQDLDG